MSTTALKNTLTKYSGMKRVKKLKYQNYILRSFNTDSGPIVVVSDLQDNPLGIMDPIENPEDKEEITASLIPHFKVQKPLIEFCFCITDHEDLEEFPKRQRNHGFLYQGLENRRLCVRLHWSTQHATKCFEYSD